MKITPKPRSRIENAVYAAGYAFGLMTMIKFAWWIWNQPW